MTGYFRKACITILIFTFSTTLLAQPDSIDVFIKNIMQKRKTPGLQLAVVRELINQNRMADALEIFILNVYLYPMSANTFDSLGEIYAELGDTGAAIKNYAQSLKLDPKNNNASEQLKKLKAGH